MSNQVQILDIDMELLDMDLRKNRYGSNEYYNLTFILNNSPSEFWSNMLIKEFDDYFIEKHEKNKLKNRPILKIDSKEKRLIIKNTNINEYIKIIHDKIRDLLYETNNYFYVLEEFNRSSIEK